MLKELKILATHGRQNIKNLRTQPVSELFRGKPDISVDILNSEIREVSRICPTGAINNATGSIDLGKCVFCRECSILLPTKIKFSNDYRMAVNRRDDLVIKPGEDGPVRLVDKVIRKEIRDTFRSGLKLRQVSAGGDNSSEMELAATGNVNFDFGRYGIEFTASPRHADGIVITGPMTGSMADPLRICYEAIPEPKVIILAGTDSISGGIFAGCSSLRRDFIRENNVDLYLPGNPVHPLTFINGIMDLLGI